MRLLALLIPLFPSLLGVPPAVAPASTSLGTVVERVEFAYYDIEGDTPQALSAALAASGPEFDGHRFFGMTEWSLSADYRVKDEAGGCTLAEVTVEIDVETQLPHWRESWRGNGALRTEWYQFLGSLDRHERGHRDLAREAADAVRDRLTTLRSETCETMRREAQWAAVDVMNNYDARHQAYDLSTGHGHTQGAVWPRRTHQAEPLLASAD